MAGPLRARLEATVQRHWWAPPPPRGAWRLWFPLAAMFGATVYLRRWLYRHGGLKSRALPVPVLVVGNLIAGGAGKTPTVIALVQALQARGWRPGVISRGHGSQQAAASNPVTLHSTAAQVGDEPLLIQRRTGVPVMVGRDRPRVAAALLTAQPQLDLIISDDGLQHLPLARDAQVIVFDERGTGNGCLLPLGPLREPLPTHVPRHTRVLYNAPAPSTHLPGVLAGRRLAGAVELAAWWQGQPARLQALEALRGRPVIAVAGTAHPERFFAMLRATGLQVQGIGLPDHDDFSALPWPTQAADVLVTEKDAVKLTAASYGATRVWVVPLDLVLPDEWVDDLARLLKDPPHGQPPA